MRSRGVAVVLALTFVQLIGAGSGSTERPRLRLPPVTSGSAGERITLRQILAALGGTHITSVSITRIGSGVRLAFEPAGSLPRSSVLRTRVRVGWEEHVVAAEFARRARERGLAPLLSFTAYPSGRRMDHLGYHRVQPFDRAKIVRGIGRAVKRSGVRLVEFNLFRPDRPVLAVVLGARHPAGLLRHRLEPIVKALNTAANDRLDAYYLAVVASSRHVVFAYADVRYLGAIFGAWSPELEGCVKALSLGIEVAPDSKSPPCPSS